MAAVKTKVQQTFRSQSPGLLPKKTERRRSRSRSRQRLQSELIRRAEQIPAVHDAMEYIASTYGVIKDTNPLLKQSLQKSEDAAYWMRQKAADMAQATRMDQPLKQLDEAAARGLAKMEEKRTEMKLRWDVSNQHWQSRWNDVTHGVRMTSEGIQNQILEGVQTVLDYVEETFEPVMLAPTPEAAKYCEDLSTLTTIRRVVDLSYRLHVGTAVYAVNTAKVFVEPSTWNKTFHPGHIQARLTIVGNEIFGRRDGRLSYKENKELLAVDRVTIALGRTAVDAARMGPRLGRTAFLYTRDIVAQIREARSVGDLTGIVLHEGRGAILGVQEKLPWTREWALLNILTEWMAQKEKGL